MKNSLYSSPIELFLHSAARTMVRYAARYLSQLDLETGRMLLNPETSDAMLSLLLRAILRTADPLMTEEEQTLLIPFLEQHLSVWQEKARLADEENIETIYQDMVSAMSKFSRPLICSGENDISPAGSLLRCSQSVLEAALFDLLDSDTLHELIRNRHNSVAYATLPVLLCRHFSLSSAWSITVRSMLDNLERQIPDFENQNAKNAWLNARSLSAYEKMQDICAPFQNGICFEKEETACYDA